MMRVSDELVLAELNSTSCAVDAIPVCDAIRPVDELVSNLKDAPSRASFSLKVAAMQAQDTGTLIARVESTENPLMLWALHLELDKRNIPPRLRWPSCDISPQTEFITWLADVYWLAKRLPAHTTSFKRWQCAFSHPPATRKWHRAVHARYLYATRRPRSGHYFAQGFSLSDKQRQHLMCFQTNTMRAASQRLKRIQEDREQLLSHATTHPDKAAKYRPADVAARRGMIWKIFLLTGGNHTETARYFSEISSKPVTRQFVSKQLASIRAILRAA